jgi:hypothetical protein
MTKERRTQKFINRSQQIRIAAEIVLHSLLFLALVCLILFAPPFATMFSNHSLYSLEDHQGIAKDLFILNATKWPLFIGLALFIGVVSILFSHHIAGPTYHVHRVISELKDRNLAVRVRFRKWDYLSELEAGFNQAIVLWQEDIQALSNATAGLSGIIRDTKAQLPPEKAKELEKQLAEMETLLKAYRGTEL